MTVEAGLAPKSRGKKELENVPSACLIASEHKRIRNILFSPPAFVFLHELPGKDEWRPLPSFPVCMYSIVTLRSRRMLQRMGTIFFLSIRLWALDLSAMI